MSLKVLPVSSVPPNYFSLPTSTKLTNVLVSFRLLSAGQVLVKMRFAIDTFLLEFCLCFVSDRKTVFFTMVSVLQCFTCLTSRCYQVPSGSKLPFIFSVHFHLSSQQYSSLHARIHLAPGRASCPTSNSVSLVTASFPLSFSLHPPVLSSVSFCPWSWKIQRWDWICWYRKNRKKTGKYLMFHKVIWPRRVLYNTRKK